MHQTTPKVGIFWWHADNLIVSSVPWTEGVDDGMFVNGPNDHYQY